MTLTYIEGALRDVAFRTKDWIERSEGVEMFRLRPRFDKVHTDYQQFRDMETLTISMWSTDGGGAGAGGIGGKYGLFDAGGVF